MKRVALILISIILNSCATGTALVTGEKRDPIDASQVKIYIDAPPKYEDIGIVKASSEMGFTDQQSQNYAVDEIKKQAAKIGANGVILNSVGDQQGSSYGTFIPNANGGTMFVGSDTAQTVSGKAIYVQH